MDLTLVIAQVRTGVPAFKTVGASADMNTAIDGVVALPAAFILPLAERATNTAMTGGTVQRITQAFGVMVALSNRRDAQGAAALADLATLRLQLRAALVGFVPDEATGEPVTYTAGRLMQLDSNARLWWMDDFELLTYYRSL